MLTWKITDPMYANLHGKEVNYVAMNFDGVCLNKMSCDLHRYDVITTHTVSVHSTHTTGSANHTLSGYSMI